MPNPEIRLFHVSPLQTNCYALVSAETDETGKRACVVVDPGGSGAEVAKRLDDVHVSMVVATHGHGDHVGGVRALCEATGAPFAISAADAERAQNARANSSHSFGYEADAPAPDVLLSEGDEVVAGGLRLRVMEAPGHTPGGIVLVGESGSEAEGIALVGDTLFAGSAGRTDLAGGSAEVLMQTLERLKRELPDETVILSGHGEPTTMECEKASNPFFAREL